MCVCAFLISHVFLSWRFKTFTHPEKVPVLRIPINLLGYSDIPTLLVVLSNVVDTQN